MASLLSPRRTIAGLSLRASDAGPQQPDTSVEVSAGPPVGWPVAAVAGGLVSALAGWVLCAGLAVVGWLAADPGTLGDALGVGTRLWLLSNGVGVSLGGLVVTLVPWGATAVVAYMMAWSAGVRRAAGPPRAAGRTVHRGRRAAGHLPRPGPGHRRLAGPALARPAALGGRHRRARVWPPSGAPAGPSVGGSPTGWPDWARALPRAVLGAQLVLLVCGAALVLAQLIRHLDRVTALHAGAEPRSRRGHRAAAGPAGPGPERPGLGGRVRPRLRLRGRRRLGGRPRRHRARHAARPAAAGRAARRRSGQPGAALLAGGRGAGRRAGGDARGPGPAGDAVRREQSGGRPGRRAGRRWCSSRSAGRPAATSGSSG